MDIAVPARTRSLSKGVQKIEESPLDANDSKRSEVVPRRIRSAKSPLPQGGRNCS